MRYLFLLAVGLTTTIAVHASDAISSLRHAADLYVASFRDRNPEGVAALTHPCFVEKMGGRAAYVESMRQSIDWFRVREIAIESITLGEASEPLLVGDYMVSFVPKTVRMRSVTIKVTSYSSLLGISSDKGQSWMFVDLVTMTDGQACELFPFLKDSVTFPERREPSGEAAEPGATDNPDDAQRLREDH